ncbi:YkgJ family cysteine cluster protein [Bacillus sp. Bva_UNVM-123]|uniref:YkgJ family cysteine cluster protein n=1 Tax=Bacillus sp. Bva_UNVM-123 TaxID=2829798 RepID=UPI00391F4071
MVHNSILIVVTRGGGVYDLRNDRCGKHSVRPEICRMFGFYEGLACFRKPKLATKQMHQSVKVNHIGILTFDFTWEDFK